uniref:Protein farnesyltransferase/geranylgeranyltransferase type-1 subunit alpha n=2 Tax=Trichobilharzia regenti TaxID=157069 RepID=A0AA85J597_TRIRE|nr:unnamed protein product [Trichobilharzia regenti]CAH8821199.1 unnamed protein product [Trichobilharzia regenti]
MTEANLFLQGHLCVIFFCERLIQGERCLQIRGCGVFPRCLVLPLSFLLTLLVLMSTCGKHLFYRDRKEWNDITPVPQDDNGRHIVNIAYSEEFVDAHDYFRAVLLKNELSERTFSLTSEILLMNPANYTAWEYRRRIIKEISSDLNAELRFVGSLIEEYSKNYQEARSFGRLL